MEAKEPLHTEGTGSFTPFHSSETYCHFLVLSEVDLWIALSGFN